MSYPDDKAIKEHKDHLWSALLQYYAGVQTFQNVEANFKSLMCDAALWVINNGVLQKPSIERVKRDIANLKMSVDADDTHV